MSVASTQTNEILSKFAPATVRMEAVWPQAPFCSFNHTQTRKQLLIQGKRRADQIGTA
jgi:hypothetical protein